MTRTAPAVVALAVAAFLAVFTVLVVRVRSGDDPALGAVAAPAPPPAQRRVLVRRVVERRVLVTVKPAPEAAPVPAAAAQSAPAAAAQSAPAAAAQSAPPSAPSPAPAPAPVATGSS
jgi:hypothetical protein